MWLEKINRESMTGCICISEQSLLASVDLLIPLYLNQARQAEGGLGDEEYLRRIRHSCSMGAKGIYYILSLIFTYLS